MLDFTYYDEDKLSPFDEDFYSGAMNATVSYLGLGGLDLGVSLQVIDAKKMQDINLKYRNKDNPTDVLSFPLNDSLVDSNFKNHGTIELGDIFICPEIALRKAEESQKTLKSEYYFLIVHGFLHLLGYDHEQSLEDEIKMFKLQDSIIENITSQE